MTGSDSWMVGEELDERRRQVEKCRAEGGQGGQEEVRVKPGQGDELPSPPQQVGHRPVDGQDVEQRQHADGDLVSAQILYGGVVALRHVGHQVPVAQLDPFRKPGGAGAVGEDGRLVRRDGETETQN